jgi:hypothetical protein
MIGDWASVKDLACGIAERSMPDRYNWFAGLDTGIRYSLGIWPVQPLGNY